MKIDVIFTGGTIGSGVSDGWISPSDAAPRLLLEKYKNKHGDSISFSDTAPYTCLSENVRAENLNMLALAVREKLAGDSDGIIVTHGTDTLQYTAAFLSLVLGKPQKCVCIVSSNYPLEDDRANGNANFEAAVEMIKAGKAGVFVPYRNGEGSVNIHHASKLLRHGEFTDEVESFGGPFAVFNGKEISFVGGEIDAGEGCGVTLSAKAPVLTVVCRPCDNFGYSLDNIKAVLMLPYHSGTLNTENEDFADFCCKCRERDIPVYAVGMPSGTTYESSAILSELGVIPLFETPFAAAYMNLWAASSKDEKIRDFMSRFCR